ncbi:aminopeptidase [Sporosarcina pasteurii]|uniref:Aminopeptidase 2 n=1 Tax=Sporosarcina pasteurii TaxID=1474 RepID=A0A380CB57_SPOPA|nr:aminopeptidase [Sporosarcina pasteurii]MDS9473346.1 aminopeptidase [Sporosarcina pasteurii]QBQ04272.1 aminopeptidase [Sporosarcina pasteurii]SUJ16919.1 Aminopeptidase 2 [Sporosarcina pasteurii]
MPTFEQQLHHYAELAVEVGVNIQPDQILFINASTDSVEFVRLITEKAYDAGARQVMVDFSDDVLSRLRFEKAPEDSFAEFPEWKVLEREKLAEKGAAFMSIVSQSPDLLSGIDPTRIATAQKASGQALDKFRQLLQADTFSWTVIAAPSPAWAAKVFPNLPTEEQIPALWNAIFKAVRANTENPVEAWVEHDKTLHEKVDYLNDKRYAKLHYRAPGTDLIVDLPKGHLWCGAGSVNRQGHSFMANMPTEEVFTVPHKTGVNGYVSSTKPLSYGGNIIDNFKLTFQDGQVTEIKAEQGEDVLQQLIDTDEGAKYLGEVALVPHASPISESNILFFNTLFDENASNHFALGSAYAFCLEGGKTMPREELEEHGLNQSITHVDFMVGSEDMDIDGILEDGTAEPIFRNGNWAF